MTMKYLMAVTAFAGAMICAATFAHAGKESPLSASGLPVPRYVSLKSDHVNVRVGPTKDNDVAWVYTRAGLPVEVTAEFENWRRVRDLRAPRGGYITRYCPVAAPRSSP